MSAPIPNSKLNSARHEEPMSTLVGMRWLYLGIIALAISGLYSIALVMLRAPIFSGILNKDIFRTTLVIHVNLSVLVWLLASMAYLWVGNLSKKYSYWVNYCNYLALMGVAMMGISPMIATGEPVLNNYIPMLENWCFIAGLTFFGCAVVLVALISLTTPSTPILVSIIIFLIASLCFILSYYGIQNLDYPLDIHFFYETLFWSGGHILQFAYTQSAMIVWVMLSGRASRLLTPLSILNILLVLPAIYAHIMWRVDSSEFIEFFTFHMKYCGGVAPSLLLVSILFPSDEPKAMIRGSRETLEALEDLRPRETNALIASMLLFFCGGCLGCLIHDINVTIPAHYHGSIVGISIAFMGLCYKALKIDTKLSRMQPWVYASGQMMHIAGLAWSGGYGVLRKTPAAELSLNAKISMGFMGFGGLVAIIGGLMFVMICGRRIFINKLTQ